MPQLCKVAPNTNKYHIEDVHRAGGIMAILGELDRAGKLHTDVPTVHAKTMKDALDQWDIARNPSDAVKTFYMAGPAGIPTQVAFSQATRWPSLDLDRAEGCIRSFEHAFSKEGGLAVLRGNIALDGCVVKTAGVDDSLLVFEGPAHVVESQDEAVADILATTRSRPATSSSCATKAPRAAPACRKCFTPRATSSPRAWARPVRC